MAEERDSATSGQVRLVPVLGLPEITADDDLAALLLQALAAQGLALVDGDILVVSSKVVSKARGLWAGTSGAGGRDRVVLAESTRVVAERLVPGGITRVTGTHAGPVLAAAGVDASNTGPCGAASAPGSERVLLLPRDPDGEAAALRAALLAQAATRSVPGQDIPPTRLAVLLTDTAGRPWRQGQADIAIGSAGLRVVDDLRGLQDADGRPLGVTVRAVADELAGAADLVKGKSGGIPAALVRGLGELVAAPQAAGGARSLVRSGPGDWFRLGTHEAVRAALGLTPGSAAAQKVGIPSAGPEPPLARATRALRAAGHALAGLGHDPAAAGLAVELAEPFEPPEPPESDQPTQPGDEGALVLIRANGDDPWLAGLATGLLVVALRGEGLEPCIQPTPW